MKESQYSHVTVLFRQMTSIWRKQFNQVSQELDLTPLDRMILVTLFFEPDCRSKSELAETLKLESQSLTRSLKRLEKKGFILRKKSMEDQRSVLHSLTNEGQKLVNILGSEADKLWAFLLKDCPTEDLQGFLKVMMHCIRRVNNI